MRLQGKVGLYARISGLTGIIAVAPYCGAVVDIEPPPLAYQPPIITPLGITYPLPYVQESLYTSSYGCPCYSSLNFDPVGQVHATSTTSARDWVHRTILRGERKHIT
jgi:hypothetical protein